MAVGLLVLGVAAVLGYVLWHAAEMRAVEARLGSGDAADNGAAYTVQLVLSEGYGGFTSGEVAVDPTKGLVEWQSGRDRHVTSGSQRHEWVATSAGGRVYRDYSPVTPMRALAGARGYDVGDLQGGVATGAIGDGTFELRLDDDGRFASLRIDSPTMGTMRATYVYGAQPAIVPIAPASRHPVQATLAAHAAYQSCPIFSRCTTTPAGVEVSGMRHRIEASEIKVEFVFGTAVSLVGITGDSGLARWRDVDGDGLFGDGDHIDYFGKSFPTSIVVHDTWAGAVVATIDIGPTPRSSPVPGVVLVAAACLAVAALRRRTAR